MCSALSCVLPRSRYEFFELLHNVGKLSEILIGITIFSPAYYTHSRSRNNAIVSLNVSKAYY